MAWNLTGSYVETCSCELMCPCNLSFDHGATYDFCRVTLVFDVHEGQIEGTDIGGLKVAAIADTPKVMTDGNWRLGVFIDAQATDEQFDKLLQVFGGQLGGPMARPDAVGGRDARRWNEPSSTVVDDGLRHSVRDRGRPSTSRSRTSSRLVSTRVSRCVLMGCSIRSPRT